jgi:hypothetical protein
MDKDLNLNLLVFNNVASMGEMLKLYNSKQEGIKGINKK